MDSDRISLPRILHSYTEKWKINTKTLSISILVWVQEHIWPLSLLLSLMPSLSRSRSCSCLCFLSLSLWLSLSLALTLSRSLSLSCSRSRSLSLFFSLSNIIILIIFQGINEEQSLLSWEMTKFPLLQSMVFLKEPYDHLWHTTYDFHQKYELWYNGKWRDLRFGETWLDTKWWDMSTYCIG